MALIDFTAKSRKFNYYTNLKDTEDTQVRKGKYDKYADLITGSKWNNFNDKFTII